MPWVLDGIFSHGAPISFKKIWIPREFGERGYYVVEALLGNDSYIYERLTEKLDQQFKFDKLHLFEWFDSSESGDVIKPKDLLLQKPWISSLVKYTYEHKAPVMGIAFEKTASHKKVMEVLRGRGYAV